jgi:hypothetical protein
MELPHQSNLTYFLLCINHNCLSIIRTIQYNL